MCKFISRNVISTLLSVGTGQYIKHDKMQLNHFSKMYIHFDSI